MAMCEEDSSSFYSLNSFQVNPNYLKAMLQCIKNLNFKLRLFHLLPMRIKTPSQYSFSYCTNGTEIEYGIFVHAISFCSEIRNTKVQKCRNSGFCTSSFESCILGHIAHDSAKSDLLIWKHWLSKKHDTKESAIESKMFRSASVCYVCVDDTQMLMVPIGYI